METSEFRVAPGPGGGRGGRGDRVLGLLQFALQLLAHAGLQRGGREPLLGEAALQEGDAGAEVGQPVDPARNLLPAEDLEEEGLVRREVTAIALALAGGGGGRAAPSGAGPSCQPPSGALASCWLLRL